MKIHFTPDEISRMAKLMKVPEGALRKLVANQKTDEELKESLPKETYEGLMETCREIDEIRELLNEGI